MLVATVRLRRRVGGREVASACCESRFGFCRVVLCLRSSFAAVVGVRCVCCRARLGCCTQGGSEGEVRGGGWLGAWARAHSATLMSLARHTTCDRCCFFMHCLACLFQLSERPDTAAKSQRDPGAAQLEAHARTLRSSAALVKLDVLVDAQVCRLRRCGAGRPSSSGLLVGLGIPGAGADEGADHGRGGWARDLVTAGAGNAPPSPAPPAPAGPSGRSAHRGWAAPREPAAGRSLHA